MTDIDPKQFNYEDAVQSARFISERRPKGVDRTAITFPFPPEMGAVVIGDGWVIYDWRLAIAFGTALRNAGHDERTRLSEKNSLSLEDGWYWVKFAHQGIQGWVAAEWQSDKEKWRWIQMDWAANALEEIGLRIREME